MIKHSPQRNASEARLRLRAILAEIEKLVPTIVDRAPMFAACVYSSPRRCGNPGCHCAAGELHPAWVMSYKEGDRVVNRSVPAEERETLLARAEEYRRFRRACRQWRKLSKEADGLFSVLLEARVVRRESPGASEAR